MLELTRIDTRQGLSDVSQLFRWRNDPRVYMYCRQFAPIHWDNHQAWVKKQSTDPKIEMFAIRHKDCLVGLCGLTDIDYINRRAEFSLYIDPNKHQCGYGKKALKELFDIGFKIFNLNLIWGESFEFNHANKLFDNLGMNKDGVRPYFYYRNGHYISAILWSITRDKWSKVDDRTK